MPDGYILKVNGEVVSDTPSLDAMRAIQSIQDDFDEAKRQWLRELNAKGIEVYYHVPKGSKNGVGQWRERPCQHPRHGRRGHKCNPVDVKITGLAYDPRMI